MNDSRIVRWWLLVNMVNNKEKILKMLATNKERLKEKFNVKEIGLFGSYIRGEERKGSDVDILVDFTDTISLFAFIELEDYLTKTLGNKVDLVSKNALKPRIGSYILQEVIYV